MRSVLIRSVGLALAAGYAILIAWLYAAQPRTMAEVRGGLAASVGVYRVDPATFEEALRYFRQDRFAEARAVFARAPRTQFYIAYSYYRQGWHRTHHDDDLYKKGLDVVTRAIALAPDGRLVVEDPELSMHSADELRAELEAGLTTDASDFDPRRLLQHRK
jgi:hypothetical protein